MKIYWIAEITHPSCESFLFRGASIARAIQAKPSGEGKLPHFLFKKKKGDFVKDKLSSLPLSLLT